MPQSKDLYSLIYIYAILNSVTEFKSDRYIRDILLGYDYIQSL